MCSPGAALAGRGVGSWRLSLRVGPSLSRRTCDNIGGPLYSMMLSYSNITMVVYRFNPKTTLGSGTATSDLVRFLCRFLCRCLSCFRRLALGIGRRGRQLQFIPAPTTIKVLCHHQVFFRWRCRCQRRLNACAAALPDQRDRPAASGPLSPAACITPSFASFFQTGMLPWSRSISMPMRSPCSLAVCYPSQSKGKDWRCPYM